MLDLILQSSYVNILLVNISTAVLIVLLSIALETVPWLVERWETLSSTIKHQIFLFGSVVITFIITGLAYAGAGVGITLVHPYIWDGLLMTLVSSAAVYYISQLTYAGTVEVKKLLNK